MKWLGAVVCAVSAVGCSSVDGAATPPAPSDDLSLPRAVDRNPDPDVVEIDLVARVAHKQYPGAEPSEVWTYDGSVPGPLIEAKVGDRLIVHFENQLPEATTIHWHGVRLPAAMDGTLAMQAAVEPGARFDYTFTLKDAGLFWFHPHVRSDVQIEKGLYGTLLVRGPDEPQVDTETVLVIDDVHVLADGSFPDYLDDRSKMMGREGNVLLVNGRATPGLDVRRGSLQRWRIVNTANGRFFQLRLEGHTLRVIGSDGSFYATPWDTERLLMSPGERYDVLVIPTGSPGAVLTLWNDPY
jgi:FtsP/CotA-like multicopper oxidase with cupredoxin domain